MDQATLTWGLLAGAIAIAVIGGWAWRGHRQRQADAARQAASAIAQARQDAQRAEQQAAQQLAAAQAAARLQAEQTIRAQAEREAQQHARAEAERAAAAAEALRLAQAQAEAQAEAQAAERAARQSAAQAAAQAAEAARRNAALATACAGPRSPAETLVMVADDSKVVRVKTSRLLAQHGYRVVLAEDGTQAAQLIETEVPAVLVTDVDMPGLDGFALTRHVRAHPRAGRIPIIMITSADDRLKAAAAEAGVTLVLGKPYPEDELIACIERSQATATA
jgi:CheY-like chemotaxis protein/F0F1-type ATP synthase membrane subunit b/b'